MKPQDLLKARVLIAIAVSIALMATTLLIWRGHVWRPEKMPAGRFPEQLVYVRSEDNVIDGGVMFIPPKMIERADHMYAGEEAQVAQIISQWADNLVSVQQ